MEGIPFVGRSGKILDELLENCSLTREEIYITNILKCHPPGNRDPKEEEKEACFPYLKYETWGGLPHSGSFPRVIRLPDSMACGHTGKTVH